MFHFLGAITNKKGDALSGFYVRLTDTSGNSVSLYSDSAGTPIINASGVADAAVVDDNGNASFYVNSGSYNVQIYASDASTLYETISDVPMSAGTWGTLGGTLSAQTDLQAALDAKADLTALDAKANLSGATFTGAITATNLSGTNTGDQNLSGLQPLNANLTSIAGLSLTGNSGLVIKVNATENGFVLATDNTGAGGSGVNDGTYGDITVSGTGTLMTVVAGAISLPKMANVATGTVFYRKTAGTGAPEVQTLATLKSDLGLTGTNSGDQFTSTTASRLLGRGSAGGAGAAQEITLGTGLSMSGTTLNASAGTSSTYTPTATAVTNVSSITVNPLQYMQIGSVVVVSGLITVTNTAANWVIDITVPVASAFTQSYQAGGAGSENSGTVTAAFGVSSNVNGKLRITGRTSAGTVNYSFIASYQVL